jgi:hypothetical protein
LLAEVAFLDGDEMVHVRRARRDQRDHDVFRLDETATNGNEISKQKWRNFLIPKCSRQLIVLITNCNWYFLRTTFVKPTYRRYEHIKQIKLGSAAD